MRYLKELQEAEKDYKMGITRGWLLEVEYKNRYGQVVSTKEYHLSYAVAYDRLGAMSQKLQIVRASVKQEFNRGEA